MFIELSKLSIFELFKIYRAAGAVLLVKTIVPLLFILAVIYCILWLNDKRLC
jgi:hypothetical protein